MKPLVNTWSQGLKFLGITQKNQQIDGEKTAEFCLHCRKVVEPHCFWRWIEFCRKKSYLLIGPMYGIFTCIWLFSKGNVYHTWIMGWGKYVELSVLYIDFSGSIHILQFQQGCQRTLGTPRLFPISIVWTNLMLVTFVHAKKGSRWTTWLNFCRPPNRRICQVDPELHDSLQYTSILSSHGKTMGTPVICRCI